MTKFDAISPARSTASESVQPTPQRSYWHTSVWAAGWKRCGRESSMALGKSFHQKVGQRIGERLSELEKHALLVFDPANIRYLTGLAFTPTDHPLAACVWADGRAALFVPHQEAEHLTGSWIDDIRWYNDYPAGEAPVRWMAREAGGPWLVDRVDGQSWLDLAAEVETVEFNDVAARLRQIKSADEIALIERAAEFADLALERTFARLTTGTAEIEVLAGILPPVDAIMRDELGERYPYPGPAIQGTLQSGTRAAWPNAPAGARRLTRGDAVVVEFIANVDGYQARSGCTFFVGDPLRDMVSWVEASIAAQDAAVEALSPGTAASEVDVAARRTLERLGLGTNVRHRTGQGTGLSSDEPPWLARSDQTRLEPGMVVVVRPGVDVSGRTGARNAKTLAIEEEGARLLNPRIERWSSMESRLKEF